MISGSEVLLTLIIALLVLGPKQLASLLRHLGVLVRFMQKQKTALHAFWETQKSQLQLEENQEKAKKADEHYRTS